MVHTPSYARPMMRVNSYNYVLGITIDGTDLMGVVQPHGAATDQIQAQGGADG